MRVTDPEGTDISYTLPDVYFNEDRTQWNGPVTAKWWPQNPEPMKRFTGGHITARPYFLLEQPGIDDVSGVIAGTMNHVGPYPRIRGVPRRSPEHGRGSQGRRRRHHPDDGGRARFSLGTRPAGDRA